MTDIKALPKSLTEFKKSAAYKKMDSENTVEQIEQQLNDAGVSFLSADNKPELIWRLLDAQDATAKETDLPADADTGSTDNPEADKQDDTATDKDANGKNKVTTDANATTETAGKPAINAPQDTADSDAPKVADKKKADFRVKNTGAFNVLEPASMTLLKVGEITDIFTTPKANKAKITANIKQINSLRGDNLKIIE